MSTAMLHSRRPKGPAWVHENPYLTIGWEETSESGAPSLKHSAMRQVLSDQSMLTPELFANIPWLVARYLWECLESSRKTTIYMWKLYATVYPAEFRKISQYNSMKIEGPRMSMREYLDLLKSDSLAWGVVLTMFVSCASVPELVEIASVKNIVALELNTSSELETISNTEIGTSMTALNDRIVRTWSELVKSSGAFAHLRVLKISHQGQMSTVSLRYFKSFPSLRYLIVHNCPDLTRPFVDNDKPREIEGWKPMHLPKSFSPAPDLSHPDKLYKLYEDSFVEPTGERSMSRDTPMLTFQVGREIRRGWDLKNRYRGMCLGRQGDWRYQQQQEQQQESREPTAKRTRHHRGVMKERKARDLNSVLQDLL